MSQCNTAILKKKKFKTAQKKEGDETLTDQQDISLSVCSYVARTFVPVPQAWAVQMSLWIRRCEEPSWTPLHLQGRPMNGASYQSFRPVLCGSGPESKIPEEKKRKKKNTVKQPCPYTIFGSAKCSDLWHNGQQPVLRRRRQAWGSVSIAEAEK